MFRGGESTMNMGPYGDFPPEMRCHGDLTKRSLWEQFHKLQNEMIVTKPGRCMFPVVEVDLKYLDPNAKYCIFLEMVLVDNCRYRYSSSSGWSPAEAEECSVENLFYMHPQSPQLGSHWMSQSVSFKQLKLTNTYAPPMGLITLSSMHKYQPRIVIVQTENLNNWRYSPTKFLVFPETQFIAVTAYQNEAITRLKIQHNPFAKGFRDEKRQKNTSHTGAENHQEMELEEKVPLAPRAPLVPNQPIYVPPRYYNVPIYTPMWSTYPFYHPFTPPLVFSPIIVAQTEELPPSRSPTDHSIRAILEM